MSDLGSTSRNLSRNWTAAQSQWTDTNSKWRDNKGVNFAERYWTTFEREVPDFIDAVHEIMGAIRESRQRIPG